MTGYSRMKKLYLFLIALGLTIFVFVFRLQLGEYIAGAIQTI